MFDCILLMAGSGSRANLNINKVYYQIDGKYLYEYSLEKFINHPDCNKIVLVIRNGEEKYLDHLNSDKIVITYGGEMRQDSVFNGMKETKEDIVLIHDGARYNINNNDITKVYKASISNSAAVLASKVTNTIKIVEDMKAVKTLNRETLWAMETPQGVNRELYLDSIFKAQKEIYYGTDDVELLEKYHNIKAMIVPSDGSNFKLTNSMDALLAETIIRGKNDV